MTDEESRDHMDVIIAAIRELQKAETVETFLEALDQGRFDLINAEDQLRQAGGAVIEQLSEGPTKQALSILFARIDTVSAMLMFATSPEIYAQKQVAAALDGGEEMASNFAKGLDEILRKS